MKIEKFLDSGSAVEVQGKLLCHERRFAMAGSRTKTVPRSVVSTSHPYQGSQGQSWYECQELRLAMERMCFWMRRRVTKEIDQHTYP